MIKIQERPLAPDDAVHAVTRPDFGAVVLFLGTVRDHHEGKPVTRLSYSSFTALAEKEILKIELAAKGRWPQIEVYVAHRTGTLDVGDVSVIIAVSSVHRAQAFEACQFIIDNLKKTVPIWKEEFYQTGKAWISAE